MRHGWVGCTPTQLGTKRKEVRRRKTLTNGFIAVSRLLTRAKNCEPVTSSSLSFLPILHNSLVRAGKIHGCIIPNKLTYNSSVGANQYLGAPHRNPIVVRVSPVLSKLCVTWPLYGNTISFPEWQMRDSYGWLHDTLARQHKMGLCD